MHDLRRLLVLRALLTELALATVQLPELAATPLTASGGTSGWISGGLARRIRHARVIGTASPANHDYLRLLGAEPVAYGEGLAGRVRALAPGGVDTALDAAGSRVLPKLIDLASGAGNVITVADSSGAREHGRGSAATTPATRATQSARSAR